MKAARNTCAVSFLVGTCRLLCPQEWVVPAAAAAAGVGGKTRGAML